MQLNVFLEHRLRMKIKALEASKSPYALFGTGRHSKELIKRKRVLSPLFQGFVSQETGTFLGYPVLTMDDVKNRKIHTIIISSEIFQQVIFEKLKNSFQGDIFKIYALDNLDAINRTFGVLEKNHRCHEIVQRNKKAIMFLSASSDPSFLGIIPMVHLHNPMMTITILSETRMGYLDDFCAEHHYDYQVLSDLYPELASQKDSWRESYVNMYANEEYQALTLPQSHYRISLNMSFDRLGLMYRDIHLLGKRIKKLIFEEYPSDTCLFCPVNFSEESHAAMRRYAHQSGNDMIAFQERPLGRKLDHIVYPQYFKLIVTRNEVDQRLLRGIVSKNTDIVSLEKENCEEPSFEIVPDTVQENPKVHILFHLDRQKELRLFLKHWHQISHPMPLEFLCEFYFEDHELDDQEIIKVLGHDFLRAAEYSFRDIRTQPCHQRTIIAFDVDSLSHALADKNQVLIYDPFYRLHSSLNSFAHKIQIRSEFDDIYRFLSRVNLESLK